MKEWAADASLESRNEAYARAACIRLFRHLCLTPQDVAVAIENDIHHYVVRSLENGKNMWERVQALRFVQNLYEVDKVSQTPSVRS